MDTSAAAQARRSGHNRNPHADPNGSETWSAACRPRASSSSGAILAGRCRRIYDVYKQNTIEHVLVRHEQAAVHAADGYARAPPATSASALVTRPRRHQCRHRHRDGLHGLDPDGVITGQVPTPAIGPDAFQECDTVGITRPIVKHNFLVKDVRDLAVDDEEGLPHRPHRPPWPVVVDILKDVSLKTDALPYPETVEMRSYNPVRKGHGGQIRKGGRCSCCGQRPYIYTGGGVVPGNATPNCALVDCSASGTNTLMGLGAMPATDPQFLGMLGMHGTYEANMTMQNCDVLLAVGARFDDRVIGNPAHFAQTVERKIIHIDIDPSSISKRVKVDIPDRRRREGRAAGTDRADPRGAAAPGPRSRCRPGGPDQRAGASARLPRATTEQHEDQAAAWSTSFGR